MSEKDPTNSDISDKEEKDVKTENVVNETEQGEETINREEVDGEAEKKTIERKESTIDRFLGWFRSRTLKAEQEETENKNEKQENEENEPKTREEKETLEDGKEVNEEKDEKKTSETLDEKEKAGTDKKTKEGEETQGKFEVGIKPQENKLPSPDRSLLIIEEVGKGSDHLAPLAQEEEEDIEDVEESRPIIDRVVISLKRADAVETENETNEKEALPQDKVDASTVENKTSATVYLKSNQSYFEPGSEKTIDQEAEKPSGQDNKNLVNSLNTVTEESKQDSKMEEIIEENHHDTRTETLEETWKKMEELEPKGTYRVSYTITTTTIEKSDKPETKRDDDDDDDDDERLFGNHGLLANNETSKPKYDGSPPQDLEPVLSCEEAKKDEAGNADVDKIFEMMRKDGSQQEGGLQPKDSQPEGPQSEGSQLEDSPPEKSPSEGAQSEEGQQEREVSQGVPETPEDIFRKLRNWDKEPTDWWTSTKKKRDYEEWMKPTKEGTIRRVIIPNVEIPYDTCVRFVTDWKCREEWDKTFSEIKILKDSKDSKLIYCPVKKRDLAFETLDRKEEEPPCYFMAWRRQMVDKEGQEITTPSENAKILQFITHTCGIILLPSESGDQATYITILCQLEGPVDNVLKNTYLAGHPKTWLRNLKKYYKKQQKGARNKVVYL